MAKVTNADLTLGTDVKVKVENKWYAAVVEKRFRSGAVLLDLGDDEKTKVNEDQIADSVKLVAVEKSAKKVTAKPTAKKAKATGLTVDDLKVGAKIEAEYRGVWYPGVVKKLLKNGSASLHFPEGGDTDTYSAEDLAKTVRLLKKAAKAEPAATAKPATKKTGGKVVKLADEKAKRAKAKKAEVEDTDADATPRKRPTLSKAEKAKRAAKKKAA